jgi:hypothetical protein
VLFHVGHLFRSLVDEQNDEVDLGMVFSDRVGQFLKQDRLTGFGRGCDQAALAFAGRSDLVHDAVRDITV